MERDQAISIPPFDRCVSPIRAKRMADSDNQAPPPTSIELSHTAISDQLWAGSYDYKTQFEANGKLVEAPISVQVERGANEWIVTESIDTPAGKAVDRVVLAGTPLALRSRSANGGMLQIAYEIADGKLIGKMVLAGREKEISAELGAGTFIDGASANVLLGTLPLSEGYEGVLTSFSMPLMRRGDVSVKVVGSEAVVVEAGSYDSHKVLSVFPDGSTMTLWVDKRLRQVVKSISKQHAFGTTTLLQLVRCVVADAKAS